MRHHDRAGAGFRHRPGLEQRKAEARLEGCVQRLLDAGAETEAHRVVGVVGPCRRLHQHRRHHAQVVHHGRARFAHAGPPGAGVKTVEHDQAAAGEHDRERGIRHRVHVHQRQRRQHTFLAQAQRRQAADLRVPAARQQEVAVRQDAALGPPGRARGVEQRAFAQLVGCLAGLRCCKRRNGWCGAVTHQRKFAAGCFRCSVQIGVA